MSKVEPLGRRFFWIKKTGNIIAQRYEMSAGIESTKEEDFEVYMELKSYNPEAIEMTTFEPGQYAEDFVKAKSWLFDPDTGQIRFIYPDPTDPETPLPPQPPLSEQVAELKQAIAELTLTMTVPQPQKEVRDNDVYKGQWSGEGLGKPGNGRDL